MRHHAHLSIHRRPIQTELLLTQRTEHLSSSLREPEIGVTVLHQYWCKCIGFSSEVFSDHAIVAFLSWIVEVFALSGVSVLAQILENRLGSLDVVLTELFLALLFVH